MGGNGTFLPIGSTSAPAGVGSDGNLSSAPNIIFVSQDDERLELSTGIREYHSGDWDRAQNIFRDHPKQPVASSLWNQMREKKVEASRAPLVDLLTGLISDAGQREKYSALEESQLRSAAASIVAALEIHPDAKMDAAIETAGAAWDADTRKIWQSFYGDYKAQWTRITQACQETEPELLARNFLYLAREFENARLAGSAWLLASFAAQHAAVANDAKAVVREIEGKRVSTEFVISHIFESGGSSVAINLLATIPAVGFTRKLYAARPWLALAAGGSIHYLSTKALMGITGYSGRILPESVGGFFGELGSSYLQSSLAIFLSNRVLWRPAKITEPAAAETAASAKPWNAVHLAKNVRAATWWLTKTSLKSGVFIASDLLTQYLPHLTGIKSMTPHGYPEWAGRLFPKTHAIRQSVLQSYKLKGMLHAAGNFPLKNVLHPTPSVYSQPEKEIDDWLAPYVGHIDADLHEMLFFELYQASQRGNFGLNVQRWIRKKIELGDFAAANATWEQKLIPIRFNDKGEFCLLDSKQFPCVSLATPKVR